MQNNQPQHNENDRVALPPRLESSLVEFQKKVWRVKIAEGILIALFGWVISYLLVFGLDRWWDTPKWIRALIVTTGSVGCLVCLPIKLRTWVWKNRTLNQSARLVRYKYPRFGDHLLGIVELALNVRQHGKSKDLVQAAMKQVDEEMGKRDLSDAVPFPRHVTWGWIAGVPCGLALLLCLFSPAASGNALWRWMMPWKQLDRYTFAQLQGESTPHVVPYAEPFQYEVRLKPDAPWKPAVGQAQYGSQMPVSAERDGDVFLFGMPPQTLDASLDIQVGDARLQIPVRPRIRPALNELFAESTLPDYLQMNDPIVEDVRGGMVSLVKGSRLSFRASATRELQLATLNGNPQSVSGASLSTELVLVEASGEYPLNWQDVLGLEPREPQVIRVEVREDQAPSVSLARFQNNQVVLPNELISFEIVASDDFGIQQLGIEWAGIEDPVLNPSTSKGEKTVAAGGPKDDRLSVAATFSALREKLKPQSIQLRAYATDYFTDRPRSYSPYMVVHIMAPEDHYQWVTEQMRLWAGVSQEIYERELQLHQTNESLSQLSREELDTPERRQQVQAQAAAERSNTDKLETLIRVGKELVQDAARNTSFDPAQLSMWAETIRALESIAGQQMPSVASLLAQGAESPSLNTRPSEASQLGSESSMASSEASSGKASATKNEPAGSPSAPDMPSGDHVRSGPLEKDLPEAITDGTSVSQATQTASVDRSKAEIGEASSGNAPPNPTPGIGDTESGFNPNEPAQASSEESPQVQGGLGLPSTTLRGSGRPPQQEQEQAKMESKPEESNKELVSKAVEVQADLIASFAKVAQELQQLLLSFENSTFVKRLKSAARQQLELASELNDLDGFGLDAGEINDATSRNILGGLQLAASDEMLTIHEDMDAYAERRPSDKFTRVLDEMQTSDVVEEIKRIKSFVQNNAVGNATIASEYWADTLDRWAEQLVDPLPPPEPSDGESDDIELPNLPPEIILEVVRLIHQEIELREETRELDHARHALHTDEITQRSKTLEQTQSDMATHARGLREDMKALPKAGHPMMQKHMQKLTEAASVMDEVVTRLSDEETGPDTIAAISEVIEILLETGRVPNTATVTKANPTQTPALLLMGIGDDALDAYIEERVAGQATGRSGRELPVEFRQGLDAYLSALERNLRE